MANQRPTFRRILDEVAPSNAAALETRARQANWLAHSHPPQAGKFFAVKNRVISQLFMMAGFAPTIQGCACTSRGLLLSIRLKAGRGQLHVPLNKLEPRAHKYVVEPRTRSRMGAHLQTPQIGLKSGGRQTHMVQ